MPQLPPEIIAQIMGYVAYNRPKPIYLAELKILRNTDILNEMNPNYTAGVAYKICKSHAEIMTFLNAPFEFIDIVKALGKIPIHSYDYYICFTRFHQLLCDYREINNALKNISKAHLRLINHRRRMCLDDGRVDFYIFDNLKN